MGISPTVHIRHEETGWRLTTAYRLDIDKKRTDASSDAFFEQFAFVVDGATGDLLGESGRIISGTIDSACGSHTPVAWSDCRRQPGG